MQLSYAVFKQISISASLQSGHSVVCIFNSNGVESTLSGFDWCIVERYRLISLQIFAKFRLFARKCEIGSNFHVCCFWDKHNTDIQFYRCVDSDFGSFEVPVT